MAKTSIIGTLVDPNGKTFQKTVTDINPNATSEQLVGFMTKFNNLTQNTYQRTDRVDRTNCDTEGSGDSRPIPTLTLAQGAGTVSSSGNINTAITYSGDGELYAYASEGCLGVAYSIFDKNGGRELFVMKPNGSGSYTNGTITVASTATANYQAATATITITVA